VELRLEDLKEDLEVSARKARNIVAGKTRSEDPAVQAQYREPDLDNRPGQEMYVHPKRIHLLWDTQFPV
jgi:hypothetical protein